MSYHDLHQENGNFFCFLLLLFSFFFPLFLLLHSSWTSQRMAKGWPKESFGSFGPKDTKGSRGAFLSLYYLFLTLNPFGLLIPPCFVLYINYSPGIHFAWVPFTSYFSLSILCRHLWAKGLAKDILRVDSCPKERKVIKEWTRQVQVQITS